MRKRMLPVAPPVAGEETAPIRQQRQQRRRPDAVRRTSFVPALAFPLLVWLVHFVIVNVSAFVAFRYGEPTGSSSPFHSQLGDPPALSGWAHHIVDPLRLWDGLWYRLIANEGYDYHSANAAFWPLFPLSMRWIGNLTGLEPDVVGYFIANITFAVALIFLYRLVELDFDQRIARRTLWALALFPSALFFSAVYTESVFLMFAAGCLLGARTKQWLLAGIMGALASLTRSYGIFLALPMAILFLRQYGLYLRELFPRALTVTMPAIGPLIFGWHLERVQGSWKQTIDVQSMWNRTFAWPWETARCAIKGCDLALTQYGKTQVWPVDGADWSWLDRLTSDPSWSLITSESFRKTFADSDTLELIFTVGFLLLAVIGLKVLPLYHSAYVFPGLIIPILGPSTVHPLMSMPRYGLTLFPLFIVLALVLKWRWLRMVSLAASVTLLVILTMQFSNWYWVS